MPKESASTNTVGWHYDAYEYIGIIVPGFVLVGAIAFLFPGAIAPLQRGVSIGDFGIILLMSLVAGHFVQSLGGLLDRSVWKSLGGQPTARAYDTERQYLTKNQIKRLAERLQKDFKSDVNELKTSRGLVKEIYLYVKANGDVSRIDKFNQSYGLVRGVASALVIVATLMLYKDPANWIAVVTCLLGTAMMILRMISFGWHYALELFSEYLLCAQT